MWEMKLRPTDRRHSRTSRVFAARVRCNANWSERDRPLRQPRKADLQVYPACNCAGISSTSLKSTVKGMNGDHRRQTENPPSHRVPEPGRRAGGDGDFGASASIRARRGGLGEASGRWMARLSGEGRGGTGRKGPRGVAKRALEPRKGRWQVWKWAEISRGSRAVHYIRLNRESDASD